MRINRRENIYAGLTNRGVMILANSQAMAAI